MVRISAKIDYACRAILELSLHWPNKEPVHVSSIAERQNVPTKFLTQILISLKQMGYVQSVRGKKGGYLLVRHPQEIQLCSVIQDLGSIAMSESIDHNQANNVLGIIWTELDEVVTEAMKELNFDIICNRQRSRENTVMFHI